MASTDCLAPLKSGSRSWRLEDWKAGLAQIQPGRPMQNGHVESFRGRLRDDWLNASGVPANLRRRLAEKKGQSFPILMAHFYRDSRYCSEHLSSR